MARAFPKNIQRLTVNGKRLIHAYVTPFLGGIIPLLQRVVPKYSEYFCYERYPYRTSHPKVSPLRDNRPEERALVQERGVALNSKTASQLRSQVFGGITLLSKPG